MRVFQYASRPATANPSNPNVASATSRSVKAPAAAAMSLRKSASGLRLPTRSRGASAPTISSTDGRPSKNTRATVPGLALVPANVRSIGPLASNTAAISPAAARETTNAAVLASASAPVLVV